MMKTVTGLFSPLSAARRDTLIFLTILACAIALRLIMLLHLTVISPDSPGYILNAMAIETKGLRSLFLAGFARNFSIYPLFIYLVNLFIDNPILSGQLVSLFFGSLLIVPVYLLVKEMMGPRAGLFAAFLTAVHPHLIRYSGEVLKDSMLFFFAITSVAIALWGHERKSYLLILLAGIMAWTTSFVRIYGIVVVGSVSVAIVVSGVIEKRGPSTIAKELLLFAVPAPLAGYLLFMIFIGSTNEYIIQSLLNFIPAIAGKFTAVASYRGILRANNPAVDPQYLDVITSYPWLSAFAEFINVFVTAFSGLFFALFLVGLYLNRTSLIKRGPCLFVFSGAATLMLLDILIVMIFFFLTKRHAMTLVILLFGWSALAIDQITLRYEGWARKKHRIKASILATAIPLFLILWFVGTLVYASSPSRENDSRFYKRAAGEYIKALGGRAPLILIPQSDTVVPLYAGGEGIIVKDPATIGATIKEKGPDFILWDTDTGPLPETIKALSDSGIIQPVETVKGTDDDMIIIYRIERQ